MDLNFGALRCGTRCNIREALKPECARWGDFAQDERGASKINTLAEWQTLVDREMTVWFPQRSEILVNQLRVESLYPDLEAPIFSQHGGSVPPGFQLLFNNLGTNDIYYTTDGSDPRLAGGQVNPLAINAGSGSTPMMIIEENSLGREDLDVRLFGTKVAVLITEQMEINARSFDSATQTWSALTVSNFTTGRPAGFGDLTVSEIHYHPVSPNAIEAEQSFIASNSDFEFIELINISTDTLDLSGLSFLQGIDFTFPDSTPLLAPGERIVVANNRAALEVLNRTGDLPGQTTQVRLGKPVIGVEPRNLGNTIEIKVILQVRAHLRLVQHHIQAKGPQILRRANTAQLQQSRRTDGA